MKSGCLNEKAKEGNRVRVLLILPAYNEQETIVNTVSRIRDARFPAGVAVDYLVINDGSADGTETLCRAHGIPCLSLVRNLGIGGAVQTGYLYAARMGYDAAVQFDGDGQHDIGSLEALLRPLLEDRADFTVGSRFLAGEDGGFRSTLLRRVGIRYLSGLIRLLTGKRVLDVTSGYRAANRKALEYLAGDYPVDYPEPESLVLLHKRGFRVEEVPVKMFQREGGQSSIGSLQSVYYMIKVTLAIVCAAMRKGGTP